MSVRINLLPEARLLKLKNQQTKRWVTLMCVLISGGVGVIIVALLLTLGGRNLQHLQNDNTIKNIKLDLGAKAEVAQDMAWYNAALDSETKLVDSRILISQLFDRLSEALPAGIEITNISVDANYKVKASVKATDYNNVALFLNALSTYNVDPKRTVAGLDRVQVFKDIQVNAVSKAKSVGGANFEVTFTVDNKLVTKFRQDNKAQASPSPSASPSATPTPGGNR